jgi:hypothetical protein
LIDEADARQVTKEVLSDFEALLGNGKNGYALVGGNGNGNVPSIDRPKVGSNPSSAPLAPANEAESVDLPFIDKP